MRRAAVIAYTKHCQTPIHPLHTVDPHEDRSPPAHSVVTMRSAHLGAVIAMFPLNTRKGLTHIPAIALIKRGVHG